MKVGLLVIGSEILEGKILDTNTKSLAEFLEKEHLQLEKSITVRDDEASIHFGLKTLLEQVDVLITSGGLGPTKDDITKASLASFLGRKVVFSEEAMAMATINYNRFNWIYPGKEHGYSWVPEGFVSLDNSTGFAPALFTQHGPKYIFCGAGVPREFKSMLKDHFVKLLQPKFAQNIYLANVNVRTKKVPEEKIFSEVDATLWDKLSELGDVSSLPKLLGVDIGIKVSANSPAALEEKVKNIAAIFEASPVKKIIWQTGFKELEEVVVDVATRKKRTFAFAESATGGLCSHRITSIPGSSKVLKGSVISYTNEVKENLLQVQHSTLENFLDVSEETAKEMAEGALKNLNVDVAISITGIAGPGGELPGKPVGTFCLGIATKTQTKTQTLTYQGDRELLKSRFSQAALFALLEELEEFA